MIHSSSLMYRLTYPEHPSIANTNRGFNFPLWSWYKTMTVRSQLILSLTLFALMGVVSEQPQARGQGFVELVSPPSLVRGQAQRIKLKGTDLEPMLGLWT